MNRLLLHAQNAKFHKILPIKCGLFHRKFISAINKVRLGLVKYYDQSEKDAQIGFYFSTEISNRKQNSIGPTNCLLMQLGGKPHIVKEVF